MIFFALFLDYKVKSIYICLRKSDERPEGRLKYGLFVKGAPMRGVNLSLF